MAGLSSQADLVLDNSRDDDKSSPHSDDWDTLGSTLGSESSASSFGSNMDPVLQSHQLAPNRGAASLASTLQSTLSSYAGDSAGSSSGSDNSDGDEIGEPQRPPPGQATQMTNSRMRDTPINSSSSKVDYIESEIKEEASKRGSDASPASRRAQMRRAPQDWNSAEVAAWLATLGIPPGTLAGFDGSRLMSLPESLEANTSSDASGHNSSSSGGGHPGDLNSAAGLCVSLDGLAFQGPLSSTNTQVAQRPASAGTPQEVLPGVRPFLARRVLYEVSQLRNQWSNNNSGSSSHQALPKSNRGSGNEAFGGWREAEENAKGAADDHNDDAKPAARPFSTVIQPTHNTVFNTAGPGGRPRASSDASSADTIDSESPPSTSPPRSSSSRAALVNNSNYPNDSSKYSNSSHSGLAAATSSTLAGTAEMRPSAPSGTARPNRRVVAGPPSRRITMAPTGLSPRAAELAKAAAAEKQKKAMHAAAAAGTAKAATGGGVRSRPIAPAAAKATPSTHLFARRRGEDDEQTIKAAAETKDEEPMEVPSPANRLLSAPLSPGQQLNRGLSASNDNTTTRAPATGKSRVMLRAGSLPSHAMVPLVPEEPRRENSRSLLGRSHSTLGCAGPSVAEAEAAVAPSPTENTPEATTVGEATDLEALLPAPSWKPEPAATATTATTATGRDSAQERRERRRIVQVDTAPRPGSNGGASSSHHGGGGGGRVGGGRSPRAVVLGAARKATDRTSSSGIMPPYSVSVQAAVARAAAATQPLHLPSHYRQQQHQRLNSQQSPEPMSPPSANSIGSSEDPCAVLWRGSLLRVKARGGSSRKKAETGDDDDEEEDLGALSEGGTFRFHQWRIDADGIQAMPALPLAGDDHHGSAMRPLSGQRVRHGSSSHGIGSNRPGSHQNGREVGSRHSSSRDRSAQSTARAHHAATLSGRSTPYSARTPLGSADCRSRGGARVTPRTPLLGGEHSHHHMSSTSPGGLPHRRPGSNGLGGVGSPLLPAVPSGRLVFQEAAAVVVNTQPWSPATNSDGGDDYKPSPSRGPRSDSDDHDGFDTEESEEEDDDHAEEIAEEAEDESILGSDTAEEEDLHSNDADIETDDHDDRNDSPTRALMQSLRLDGRIGAKPIPQLRGVQMATPQQTRLNLVRLEELGRGAGGVVYKAVHVPTLTVVAVKQIYVEDDAARRQMTHELSLLHAFNARPLRPSSSSTSSSLANQCRVVQLHDAFTDQELGSCVCLVLEYMAGGALDLPVKRKEPLNEAQLAHVAGSVCAALVDLRRRRLLHRDVKPSNILVDGCGRVKLSDFGIMRDFLGHEASLSHTFTGTLAYMAPERLSAGSSSPYGGGLGNGVTGGSSNGGNNGDDGHDQHVEEEGYSYPADVWGLGLSLLALALGRPPLTGRMRSVWDVLAAQEERAPRPQSRPGSGASNQEQHPHILSLRAERDQRLAAAAEAAAKEAANARPGSSNSSRSVLKPAFTAELCDFVECCLRRDPKARLTAEELLAHPFLVRHRNKAAASLSSSSARPHQQTRTPHEDTGKEEEGDDEAAAHEGSELFDGWGSTSSLFRPLETSDACAARLFSAIVRHLNAANSHEKNRQHNRDEEDAAGPTAALPLIGLRDDQLASLCAQLPSLTLERAKAMHDQALQVLRDEDARLVAMAAARVRAAAQAQEASLKAAAASAAGDPPSRHHRRGQSGSDRTRRRDSRK